MQITFKTGDPNIAQVYVIKYRNDERLLAECVDAVNPGVPRDKKWVLILSTQFGCPVECAICDAGGSYFGDLTADEIISQIDTMTKAHPAHLVDTCEKFKIQFARMGEPSLNQAVLDVLEELPKRYRTNGLMPCIATTAPKCASNWFERLCDIRSKTYASKHFQLQFSVNSTDEVVRNRLMPIDKWTLEEIATYGKRFYRSGDRKIALNFALMEDVPLDTSKIATIFSPDKFCIKVTPLNPNYNVASGGHKDAFESSAGHKFIDSLCNIGFDVIVSLGDLRENEIGSNCGQAIRFLKLNEGARSYRPSL